jgi:hypothetical protein
VSQACPDWQGSGGGTERPLWRAYSSLGSPTAQHSLPCAAALWALCALSLGQSPYPFYCVPRSCLESPSPILKATSPATWLACPWLGVLFNAQNLSTLGPWGEDKLCKLEPSLILHVSLSSSAEWRDAQDLQSTDTGIEAELP